MIRALCIALVVVVSSIARADQRSVRAIMDKMEIAVLAGDGPSYLKFVAGDDPVLLKEQQNWAADLKRHKPVEFKLEIVSSAPEWGIQKGGDEAADKKDGASEDGTFGDERAAFKLKMSWKMDKSAGKTAATLRQVSYPVEFVRKNGGWLYRGEAWQVLEKPADSESGFEGVRVFFAPGLEKAAELVAEVMPGVREKVDALFDNKVKRVQEVKLYTSTLHLQESIYLSYEDGLGGWNEPGESVKILSRSKPSANGLKSLLGHEYGHVATFEMWVTNDDSPWWILEGVAELSAGHVRGDSGGRADRTIINWYKNGKLAAWKDLSDFRNMKPGLGRHVYTQGEHFVRWLTGKVGDRGRNRWIRLMGEGKTLDEATKAVMGLTFEQADADWREDVAKLAKQGEEEEAEGQ